MARCRHAGERNSDLTDSPSTLYKLIVLYALDQTAYPLTNAQISDLFMDNQYTTYFHIQEILSDMSETGLLETEKKHNTTYYSLSGSGKETIRFFSGDISHEIRSEVKEYLRKNARSLRNDSQTSAEYARTASMDYAVHCRAAEDGIPLIDLTLTVPTENAAKILAENWKTRSQEAYEILMKLLT